MAEEEQQQQRKEQPIIIKKKRKDGGHPHHGGAWKVAYADFVTALMAFFIVMWILATLDQKEGQQVRETIAAFFSKPGAFDMVSGKPRIPLPDILQSLGKGSGESDYENKGAKDYNIKFDSQLADSLVERLVREAKMDSVKAAERVESVAKELKEYIKKQVAERPELKDILSSIKIEMTNEGLRIELIETSESLFFEVGSAIIKPKARIVLDKLAKEIGKLPNYVEVEGHTDSRQYGSRATYTNWELSSDRAQAARRVLEQTGLWDGQIVRVTGFADKRLRLPSNPFDMSNRRVSILIKQLSAETFLEESASQVEEKKNNEENNE